MNSRAKPLQPERPIVVDLHGAFLRGADWTSANLANANFAGANLVLADFSGSNLAGADLRDADLTSAGFSGVDLRGADLRGAAGLEMQQLAAAVIDDTTLLPDYVDRVLVRQLAARRRGAS